MAKSCRRKNILTVLNFRILVPKMLRKLLFDKRAVSVAVSTMIITAGVIAMGIAVLYWTYSWGNMANKQYVDNMQTGSNAMEERISFECISYSSSSKNLTVNLLNWGKAKNTGIARIYIWDNNHEPVGSYSGSDLVLKDITTNEPIQGNVLDIGNEGYITFNVGLALDPYGNNSYFSIRVVTQRGRSFDGSFVKL